MRIVLAALLLAHGVAHLPGLLVSWKLRSFAEMPYRTTILGGSVDIGEGGVKAVGLAWLVLSIVFVLAGAATLMRAGWWQPSFMRRSQYRRRYAWWDGPTRALGWSRMRSSFCSA